MTEAKSYWRLVVFRCVSCRRNEAFAEESCAVEPREIRLGPRHTKLSAGIAAGRAKLMVFPR